MVDNYEQIFQTTASLETERLLLRPFSLEDCGDVFEYGSDAQTVKYLTWEALSTPEDARNTISNYYTSTPGIFAIALKGTGKCIGTISLRPDWANESADFGYVLNKHYWGQGLMTEALGAIFRFSFGTLLLHRIGSTHYVGNEGSGRVMAKCGMKYEGTALQEVKVKGIFHDVVHYGITREQWLAEQ